MATLYRCTTPTNWLCPCGRVARALKRDGIAFEEVEVPQRRSRRPEVEALTGQRRVPVLVIDGEAICDSRRIVEHLEFMADESAVDHRLLSRAPVGRGERVRQLLERDRRATERAPQGLVGGERAQRLVDLLGGVVERAAQLELLVVERPRLEADLVPVGQPPTSTTTPPGAVAAAAARHASGRPTASNTSSWRVVRCSSDAVAPSCSAWARRSACGSATVTFRPCATRSEVSISPIGPPPTTPTSAASVAARAADGVDRGCERLCHRRGVGGQSVGDRVQCRCGRRDPLGEAAEHPGRRAADLGAPGCALPACAAGHRVGHEHALARVGAHARRLVAEPARIRRQHPMSVAPHLGVGPARRRRLDLDDHLTLGVGDVLDPEVLRAEQDRGPHGSTTTLRPPA